MKKNFGPLYVGLRDVLETLKGFIYFAFNRLKKSFM